MIPSVTTWVAYDIEKRISKYPDRFGKGCIEGVASPEANNNANSMTSFVPLMALGIPVSPTTAVLLAAFIVIGLPTGPLLFKEHGDFVWTIIASMYIGNVILLILNLPLVGLWARICLVPYRVLGPLILGTCFIGTYSVRNSIFDVGTCIFFGLLGYAMKKRNWPVVPLILGFLLGDMFEQNLRASLQISRGSIGIFFTRPIVAGFIVLAAFMVIISRRFLVASER
jgi:putative tricarboxylic transport membrane protein